MRFLFFNLPAHGHINPSLPLVRELTARGHEVIYYATETFRARIEAAGARVETLPSVTDSYFADHGQDGSTPWQIALILQETSAALLPELLEIVRAKQPDAILYDCMVPWGYYLARAAKLPGISSYSVIPMTLNMLRDPRVLRLSMLTVLLGMRSLLKSKRIAATIAKQYDLTPLTQIRQINVSGDLCLIYSSAEFVPHSRHLTPEFRFFGWTLHESVSTEAYTHTSGRPLIYASIGTLINNNPEFFRAAIAAFGTSGYDLLISTGGAYQPQEFGALPPNVTVRAWVLQAQVLRQASLFITHGGVNSILDGLYCDLPLLVVPQQSEQTINSLAVIDQKAGIMLKPKQVNAESLRTSAQTLLTNPTYRQNAARLGASLRSGGGPVAAVDAIEALVRGR